MEIKNEKEAGDVLRKCMAAVPQDKKNDVSAIANYYQKIIDTLKKETGEGAVRLGKGISAAFETIKNTLLKENKFLRAKVKFLENKADEEPAVELGTIGKSEPVELPDTELSPAAEEAVEEQFRDEDLDGMFAGGDI